MPFLGTICFHFQKPLKIIRENLREYAFLNLLYYGLVVVSMIYVYAFPEVQKGLIEELRGEFREVFPWLVEAYMSGNFPLATILTFLINLTLGAFVYITLPSYLYHSAGL